MTSRTFLHSTPLSSFHPLPFHPLLLLLLLHPPSSFLLSLSLNTPFHPFLPFLIPTLSFRSSFQPFPSVFPSVPHFNPFPSVPHSSPFSHLPFLSFFYLFIPLFLHLRRFSCFFFVFFLNLNVLLINFCFRLFVFLLFSHSCCCHSSLPSHHNSKLPYTIYFFFTTLF